MIKYYLTVIMNFGVSHDIRVNDVNTKTFSQTQNKNTVIDSFLVNQPADWQVTSSCTIIEVEDTKRYIWQCVFNSLLATPSTVAAGDIIPIDISNTDVIPRDLRTYASITDGVLGVGNWWQATVELDKGFPQIRVYMPVNWSGGSIHNCYLEFEFTEAV